MECHIEVFAFEQMGDAGHTAVAKIPTCETLDVHGADDITVAVHREEEARDG
ncbi:hypothetical protein [Mycolicibacterium hippocampi]|jgi:hypothetical protein|uniref:Uncharacterized protein n=1 Tax=Mycolicibacterium hippocampi TaxID=659824 RepID=A0A850PPR8_9MYCO|nr:hypothetical protein [Mycolicibacterium hippocampi]NVN50194.1 hypothetical protein [Mycolicibacterium hippocampi]